MNVNQYEINEIATDPDDDNVFMARDFTELNEIRGRMKQAMCNGMTCLRLFKCNYFASIGTHL